MNLPSDSATPTDRNQDGRPSTSESATTPKALPPRNPMSPSINTAVAMTVTPASALASASSSNRSVSPMGHVPNGKSRSSPWQDSPDFSLSPQAFPSSPPVVTPVSRARRAFSDKGLSERSPSPQTRGAPPGAMAEAIAASRSPGLIRRLSRGASQRLRRKASHQQTLRMRDNSAGPVLLRRRSDSNATSEHGGPPDMSDLELEPNEDVLDDPPYPRLPLRDRNNALGISVGRTSSASNYFEGGIAPSISAVLQAGTWTTKFSRKKTKRIKLWLDPNSARVCWHLTNTSKSFFIDDISEVRTGADSRNAREDAQVPEKDEDRFITVVYRPLDSSKGRTTKTMQLLMDSDVVRKYWEDALGQVTRDRAHIMNALSLSREKSERSMEMAWRKATGRQKTDPEAVLTLDGARSLCRDLEINCSDDAVKTHFKTADTKRTGLLDFSQFRDFVGSFKQRKDVQNLYRNVKFGTDLDMDLETFLSFLQKDQMIDVDKDRMYWEGVFDRFAESRSSKITPTSAPVTETPKTMNMQSFQSFLTSGYNASVNVNKGEVSLTKPLNEYFISSSHNTYLLGRQVAGTSSVEGYVAALIKGCRCVEIDCWDGDGGRPMVTHGRTMTTKVSFEDCVSTIGRYAFHNSPYPLIVSLEVHCNEQQQKTMVDLMKKYWKDTLVTEPITTNAMSLPSPEELKGRILVKVKAAEEPEVTQMLTDMSNGRSRGRSIGSAFSRTSSVDKQGVPHTQFVNSPPALSPSETNLASVSTPRGSTTSGPTMSPSSTASDSDDAPLLNEKNKSVKTSQIHPELGKLGVYAQGFKFHSFNAPEAQHINHIFSVAEGKFNKQCDKPADAKTQAKNPKVELEKHNMRYLMRVYPSGKRIDSSNFNPLASWRRGVQMAALNWQTYDVNQQVNEAMFASGPDRLGYVLKPEELRPAKHLPIADTLPETADRKAKKGKKLVKFAVEIISAQRLPRPRGQSTVGGMNPYIEFEMYSADDKARGNATSQGGTDASARDGSSGIGSPLRKRTKVIEGNGFDPIYNQPISMSVETKFPSLIFVRWTVWHSPQASGAASNNVLLATYTAKLSSLQQGYRHLPLFNPQGEQYRDAKLFVKIRKEAPQPLQQDDNAYGGGMDPSSSPRPEFQRAERSWRSRVFSRNPSERRKKDSHLDEGVDMLSRTSSMERDAVR